MRQRGGSTLSRHIVSCIRARQLTIRCRRDHGLSSNVRLHSHMPLPFLLSCKQPSVRVFELADGRFQLVEHGEVGPVVFGYKHLLVEAQLATFLKGLGLERVQFEPTAFFVRSTGKEWSSHERVRVGQYFTMDQMQDFALDGQRILILNDEYYFVSPSLKQVLERAGFDYLEFTEGLTGFAAGAA